MLKVSVDKVSSWVVTSSPG